MALVVSHLLLTLTDHTSLQAGSLSSPTIGALHHRLRNYNNGHSNCRPGPKCCWPSRGRRDDRGWGTVPCVHIPRQYGRYGYYYSDAGAGVRPKSAGTGVITSDAGQRCYANARQRDAFPKKTKSRIRSTTCRRHDRSAHSEHATTSRGAIRRRPAPRSSTDRPPYHRLEHRGRTESRCVG